MRSSTHRVLPYYNGRLKTCGREVLSLLSTNNNEVLSHVLVYCTVLPSELA